MKIKSFLLTIVAVAFVCNPCFADPADSLVNITKWETSDGGNGHTYAVLKMTLNWTEANALAPTLIREGMKGYLATITTPQENSFIRNSLLLGLIDQPSILDQFYLGGIYVNQTWVWQPDEPVVYFNWNVGEPNNVGVETVMAIWGYHQPEGSDIAGLWNNTLPDDSFNRYAIQWSIIEWNKSELLNSVIEPNQIDAADSRPKDSALVSIYLMDFLAPYTPNDIDQNSLLINGHLAPLSATGSTSFGDAIKVDVLLHDFLKDYVIIWDTTTLDYSIEGKFVDGTPFKIVSSFQAIGENTRGPNSHSNVSVTHLTIFINMMFRGLSVPRNTDAFDFDGSCDEPNVSDLRYLIDFLFRGGPPPVPGCTE